MPVKLQDWLTRRKLIAMAASVVLLGTIFLVWRSRMPRPERMPPGKFPEQLVYVRSKDDIVDAGVVFIPAKGSAKPIAVIWIHGWGVNFYSPTYVAIGRALAERGYTTISANTRMHDLGNVQGYRWGKRIRGGGYWGIASEEVRDLAAWVDFTEDRGFKKVVLVGHSAGWAAVRTYQAERQDARIVGVVVASGAVGAETRPTDPDQLSEATRLMAKGEGDALIRDPRRSFPSYISAATFMDIANSPPEYKDFFGVQTPNPGVTRIRCPLLAFFGTQGDVGTEADLELMKSSIQRQSSGPSRVDTVMIQHADHMYQGEEAQVAQTIAHWADSVLPRE
ncbi:MAG: alpha/beta fold hydrolase [Acidobacteria bacterium]|nr:alpha/beta fold hydrolase [Acidobacteriota bacterium]